MDINHMVKHGVNDDDHSFQSITSKIITSTVAMSHEDVEAQTMGDGLIFAR
jgi:hypothetical protein